MSATDPALGRLTRQQVRAAGTTERRVYIEAWPGSGKTTVAAQRFGVLRYAPGLRYPGRGVTAVSFTRSATAELRGRVRSSWGPTALTGAHRIITLDTLVYDLFRHLLSIGLVEWPGGHTTLTMLDSWKVGLEYFRTHLTSDLDLVGNAVRPIHGRVRSKELNPTPALFDELVANGFCTHEALRGLLSQAALLDGFAPAVAERLRETTSALIVDEIFDANELDLTIVTLTADLGIPVTVIGDPWQALYGFRGAQPHLVPQAVAKAKMRTFPLTKSFRWQTQEQSDLADQLRASQPVTLPTGSAAETDVVLAFEWNELWAAGPDVLPIAFRPQPGNFANAIATVLLHVATTNLMGLAATFINDALITLGLPDFDSTAPIAEDLEALLTSLATGEPNDVGKALWPSLVQTVQTVAPRTIPSMRVHKNYWGRLAQISERLHSASLVPGLTVHQAKGREWPVVGVRLSADNVAMLRAGLTGAAEPERQLYVALTRARLRTIAVP